MNRNRAKLPWQRRYNWRIWYCKHKRSIRLLILAAFIGLIVWVGNKVIDLYISKLEAEYQKVSVVGACWAKEMAGAPKTPEDAVVFKEPVGWKLASNWCKDGWQEECK